MRKIGTEIPGVFTLEPKVLGDARGFFMETYSERSFAEMGIACRFVQDNHSLSRQGVLRGLHYQIEHPQAKLVRVIRGEVFDVAVDIRKHSPTFGKWVGAILSAENKRLFFVPEGFAHGFYVLSAEAEFSYKCSDFYYPSGERGIRWDDPAIGITWPLLPAPTPLLSEKDKALPLLAEVDAQDLPVHAGMAN